VFPASPNVLTNDLLLEQLSAPDEIPDKELSSGVSPHSILAHRNQNFDYLPSLIEEFDTVEPTSSIRTRSGIKIQIGLQRCGSYVL
jgi:hypothetical protein